MQGENLKFINSVSILVFVSFEVRFLSVIR